MKHLAAAFLAFLLCLCTPTLPAQAPEAPPAPASDAAFNTLSLKALAAMRKRAAELKIEGVALVAFCPGDTVQSWNSRMTVVGKLKAQPNGDDKGSNLLAIAYSKASEMADTLKDSGSHVRPPLTGEFGWSGGVIVQGKTGYLIAAFSGGESKDDVRVSQAGLAELKSGTL